VRTTTTETSLEPLCTPSNYVPYTHRVCIFFYLTDFHTKHHIFHCPACTPRTIRCCRWRAGTCYCSGPLRRNHCRTCAEPYCHRDRLRPVNCATRRRPYCPNFRLARCISSTGRYRRADVDLGASGRTRITAASSAC